MRIIGALMFGCLALNCWAQENVGNAGGLTNTASSDSSGDGGSTGGQEGVEFVWVGDSLPAGAITGLGEPEAPGGRISQGLTDASNASTSTEEAWQWISAWPSGGGWVHPVSGSKVHVSPLHPGFHEHYFTTPTAAWPVGAQDAFFCYINIDPTNPPTEIMLQWYVGWTNGPGLWEHRAYWGDDAIAPPGYLLTNRVYMGAVPTPGQWVRLEAPVNQIGLQGQVIQGMAFTLYGGAAAWGPAGKLPNAVSIVGSPRARPDAVSGEPASPGIIANASVNCVPQPPNIVAWWMADGNAIDFISSTNGAIEGGVTFATGEVGPCFDFDGSTGYVDVPNSTALQLPTALTIEFWVKRQRTNALDYVVEKGGDWYASGRCNYEVALYNGSQGNYCLYLLYNGGWQGGGSIADFNWHHCAITATNTASTVGIFIDGVWQPVTHTGYSTTVKLTTSSDDLHIGAQIDPSDHDNFYGNIYLDELSIYSRILTTNEIMSIYQAGATGKCSTCTAPSISSQPGNSTVCQGSSATFSVGATGTGLSYQWTLAGTNIPGANASSYTIPNVQTNQAGSYAVVVENACGTLVSSNALLTVNVCAACAPPPPNLVAWWRAETNPIDAVSGTNGTLYGGVSYAAGEVGQCFDIDGSTGYVDVPNSAALQLTNAITIEFWVKRQRTNALDYVVEKGGDWMASGQCDFEVALYNSPENYCLYFLYDGGLQGGGSIRDFNWHHCAITAQNGTTNVGIYIDGAMQPITFTAYTNTVHLSGSSRDLHIGAQIDPQSGWNFYGQIYLDELSLYNRCLTATEIANLYLAGSAGKCVTCMAPAITTQPQDQIVWQGQNVTFSVATTGTAPLSYQWTFNGGIITGATASVFTIANVQTSAAGSYAVTVTNSCGAAASTGASLVVNGPPVITTQPQGEIVCQGQNAAFSVATSGLSLSYQWRLNGVAVPNATASTLTINNAQPSAAGTYTVVVSNPAGNVISAGAVLTVNTAPTITIPPASQSVPVGANVTFSVVATGTQPLSYQWTFNANNIPGATTSLYSINNAQTSAAGTYAVQVSSASCASLSPGATLTVGSFDVWISQPKGNSDVP